METRILSLFARTPVHVGAGNSVGAVDSPVMRERHTRIPIIPGSSLKGVLRDLFEPKAEDTCWLFGNEQSEKDETKVRAGALLIGEARVLAFPVRSARGGFAWISCPLALARYRRDAQLAFPMPDVQGETCLAPPEIRLDEKAVLEEYCLPCSGPSTFPESLKALTDDAVWAEASTRFVVVSDEIFSHFVEHACEVVTRVRIDDDTGVVAKGALFNQENVPSETLFYTTIAAQDERSATGDGRTAQDALDALKARIDATGLLQVGGDATIGLGCCTVKLSD